MSINASLKRNKTKQWKNFANFANRCWYTLSKRYFMELYEIFATYSIENVADIFALISVEIYIN